MQKLLITLFTILFTLSFTTVGQAASVTEQINQAIRAGDFKTVAALAAANPSVSGQTELALLTVVKDNLQTNWDVALQAMNVATPLVAKIDPASVNAVAIQITAIAAVINDKHLVLCSNDKVSNETTVSTTGGGSAGIQPNAESVAAAKIMSGLEAMAQTTPVVAANPKLYAQLAGDATQCDQNTAELAQRPGSLPLNGQLQSVNRVNLQVIPPTTPTSPPTSPPGTPPITPPTDFPPTVPPPSDLPPVISDPSASE